MNARGISTPTANSRRETAFTTRNIGGDFARASITSPPAIQTQIQNSS
jgi:hypothetical protein